MFSIFTTAKAFEGEFEVLQRNALTSWTLLEPRPQIILLGNDPGVSDIARELRLEHVPELKTNREGTPLLDDVFRKGQLAARERICAYVNADIILLSDFVDLIRRFPRWRSLAIGRRWDWDSRARIDFAEPRWEQSLRATVLSEGQLYREEGLDYFVFRKGVWKHELLPFAIGRYAWDNYLVYEARKLRATVIDATSAVLAIHQTHGYSHIPGGSGADRAGHEAQRNLELIRGREYFDVRDATWELRPSGLRPRWRREDLRRRWRQYWVTQPPLWQLGRTITKPIRQLTKAVRTR